MFKTNVDKALLISAIVTASLGISLSLFLMSLHNDADAQSNPCGPSDNAAQQYAPGRPGGYPPGQNPFQGPPGAAPGQIKQNQVPLP